MGQWMHRWMLALALVAGWILAFSPVSWAEDVVEITAEKTVTASSPNAARQQVFDEVVQETAEKYILDIIGSQKYERNKVVIRKKILKDSRKYILSMKSSKPVKAGKGFQVSVVLKFSVKNLQALLLEHGLLYKMEGAPRVIPMVSFQDRVNGRTHTWWVGETGVDKSFMVAQSRDFLNKLRSEMRESGFFSLSPMGSGYRNMMPTAFMSDNPRTEDYLFLGEYFDSQIVVKGFIRYAQNRKRSDAYQVDVKLVALHSGNGRVVGEVIRTYETDAGPFQATVTRKMGEVMDTVSKDLAAQVYDAWKRGTFGANLLRLAVNGKLQYPQLMELKKQLVDGVRDIRTLKERFFEQNRVVFEMDASSGTRQIAQVLESKAFKPFRVKVSKVNSNTIELDVR
ncbi:MAG: hypothetical protein H6624_04850 [Bdellovibrionaceae bacterium]|nr:hypothetical protein [Bdellovibrionales bacterium]MCB9083646.1 hypothetical protein [Pseudobdellovibrionaceae bacterium]